MFAVRMLSAGFRVSTRYFSAARTPPTVPTPPLSSQSCDLATGKCAPVDFGQKQAYAEMTKVESFIYDIRSIEDWTERVMKSNVPVVLQCHADWCTPCRRLMPVLEKATMEGGGKWALAKVDIDEMKPLAQALKVSVVPVLFLVHRGQAVHRIEGPDEEGLKKFLEDVKLIAGLSSEEDSIKGLHAAGEDFLSQQSWDNAIHSFEEILKHGKWKGKYELSCLLHLAQAYKGKKDLSAAETLLGRINAGFPQDVTGNKEAQKVVSEVELWIKGQTMDEGYRMYEETAVRMEREAREAQTSAEYCRLAELHLKNGNSKEAIECALKAIEIDKSFKGEGQTTMIAVFKALGPTHELVREARKRVQRLHAKFTV